jgi:hypothetical protein
MSALRTIGERVAMTVEEKVQLVKANGYIPQIEAVNLFVKCVVQVQVPLTSEW